MKSLQEMGVYKNIRCAIQIDIEIGDTSESEYEETESSNDTAASKIGKMFIRFDHRNAILLVS